MNGKVIAGKYQLLEKVRDGRFYETYIGRLAGTEHRFIVKIVSREFVEKNTTLNTLKPTFHVLAGLRHGGVIPLVEYGEEGDTIYLIEEFYAGELLQDVLQKNEKIPTHLALEIAIKLVEAVSYAHARGLCHGLLTPESIVIQNDLTLRVGDFHYLSALSSTLSVSKSFQGKDIRFCAPEVISGLAPNFQSDIYSIGIVLYALMTGRLPYQERGSVSAALEKIQSEAPSPRSLNPDIPPILDAVILKAIRKKPSLRYTSAQELLSELLLCRTSLSRAMAEMSGVEAAPATGATANGVRAAEGVREPLPSVPVQPKEETSEDETAEVDELTGEKKAGEKPQRAMLPLIVSGGAFLFLFIFVFAFGIHYIFGGLTAPSEVIVPNVVGKNVVEAKAILGNRNLVPTEAGVEYSEEIPEGYIVRQDPAASTKVKENRTINLFVSSGKRTVSVPDVTQMTPDQARAELEQAGLALGSREVQYNDTVASGKIVSQHPEAKLMIPLGTKVNVVVSNGPEPVMSQVPQVTDMSVDEARSALADAGFAVGREISVPNSSIDSGRVAAQSYLPGSVAPQGSAINLYVTAAPTEESTPVDGTVNLKISTAHERQEVVIIIADQEGVKESYREYHRDGDQLRIPVSGVGPTRVLVYLDGSLVKDQSL